LSLARRTPVESVSEEEAEPRQYNHLAVKLGQHWSVVGKTGSGKTRFSLALLEYYRRQFPHVPRYVLNSTDDDMPEIKFPREIRGNTPPDIQHDSTYTQVWIPDTDDLDAYNEWLLKILYARKKAIVLLDEIASLTGYGKQVGILEGHFKILKQGRKHGITIINETQELSRVPLVMFRQMEYFVLFRINNDAYEISTARKYLEVERDDYRPPHASFGFHLKRTGNFPAREYRSMHDLFGQHFRP
jgi:hypothetical protein